jgi:hypothetical protein
MIKIIEHGQQTGWNYDIQDIYDVYSGVFYDSIYKFEVRYSVKYDESGGWLSYFHPNTFKEVDSIREVFKGLKIKNETRKEAKEYFINQVLSATDDNLTEGKFKVLSYKKEKKRGRL